MGDYRYRGVPQKESKEKVEGGVTGGKKGGNHQNYRVILQRRIGADNFSTSIERAKQKAKRECCTKPKGVEPGGDTEKGEEGRWNRK